MTPVITPTPVAQASLRRFGYTEVEAAFLQQVAWHSGYFLRRQYATFLDRQDGSRVSQLIDKALAHEHVRASSYRQKIILYHLCARPFYAALGQEDNRHRRRRGPASIKSKLMAFDFVLSHPPASAYRATEQEKIAYFTETLGLPLSALPATVYRSRRRPETTARYFIEKYPIRVSPASAPAPPVVTFCFIDGGLATLSHFETFLTHYGRLWSMMPAFELVYVAATETPFAAARMMFDRFTAKWRSSGQRASDPDLARLLDHFEARARYAAKDFASFDRAGLIRFRNEREEFSGPRFDALYSAWVVSGPVGVQACLGRPATAATAMNGHFSTCVLPYDYDVFRTFTAS
jgi:hypothetical protein